MFSTLSTNWNLLCHALVLYILRRVVIFLLHSYLIRVWTKADINAPWKEDEDYSVPKYVLFQVRMLLTYAFCSHIFIVCNSAYSHVFILCIMFFINMAFICKQMRLLWCFIAKERKSLKIINNSYNFNVCQYINNLK